MKEESCIRRGTRFLDFNSLAYLACLLPSSTYRHCTGYSCRSIVEYTGRERDDPSDLARNCRRG